MPALPVGSESVDAEAAATYVCEDTVREEFSRKVTCKPTNVDEEAPP
jgi:hypothetical protein